MRKQMRISATILMSLGIVCAQAWSQQSAAGPNTETIRMQESVVEKSSGDGIAWLKLAVLYQDAARYQDSERAYRKAIAMLKSKDPSSLATALDHMGTMYVESGKFAKAEPLERKALAIRQDTNDSEGIGTSYTHLASLSYGRHDLAAAEADAEMAVSILIPAHTDHPAEIKATPEEQMSALINLSLIRCGLGACSGTIPDLDRALRLAHAHYAINSVPVGLIDFLLGYAHWKSGNYLTATELMQCGTTEMETQLGWGHPTYVAALRQYRTLLAQGGHAAEANQVEIRIASLEKSPRSAFREPGSELIGLSQLH